MSFFNIGAVNMIKNMSNTDRIIRILVAGLFAYLYFGGIITGILGIALMIFAAVFIITSSIAFCPLYSISVLARRRDDACCYRIFLSVISLVLMGL